MAQITRQNYNPEYTYFLPFDSAHRIESSDSMVRVTNPNAVDSEIQTLLNNHAMLTVNATKGTILANGIDSTNLTITGEMTLVYRVMHWNIEIASGAVFDGVVEFSTDEPGEYLFELLVGDLTGYAKVIANNE